MQIATVDYCYFFEFARSKHLFMELNQHSFVPYRLYTQISTQTHTHWFLYSYIFNYNSTYTLKQYVGIKTSGINGISIHMKDF